MVRVVTPRAAQISSPRQPCCVDKVENSETARSVPANFPYAAFASRQDPYAPVTLVNLERLEKHGALRKSEYLVEICALNQGLTGFTSTDLQPVGSFKLCHVRSRPLRELTPTIRTRLESGNPT